MAIERKIVVLPFSSVRFPRLSSILNRWRDHQLNRERSFRNVFRIFFIPEMCDLLLLLLRFWLLQLGSRETGFALFIRSKEEEEEEEHTLTRTRTHSHAHERHLGRSLPRWAIQQRTNSGWLEKGGRGRERERERERGREGRFEVVFRNMWRRASTGGAVDFLSLPPSLSLSPFTSLPPTSYHSPPLLAHGPYRS